MATTPTPTPNSNLLQEILMIIGMGASTAAAVSTGQTSQIAIAVASLDAMVVRILAVRQSIAGQPIDPALLKPFEPLP